MTPRTRERAARILLASFLTSDLTTSELKQISDDILASPNFLSYISTLLREMADRLAHSGEPGASPDYSGPSNSADRLYSAIQRRRLSKTALLDMMAHISPHISPRPALRAASVRQLLHEFLARATESQTEELANLLSRGPDDAYLRGIMKKG